MENKMIDNVKPDIIIDYQFNMDCKYPIFIISVRPETNEVFYEKAIILGISKFADIVYLANLNGKLFLKSALILDHYAIQYKFSIYAKEEISKYPEMIAEFEKHFNTKFDKANIIGSFDAILKLNISADDLFNTIVGRDEFLYFYGQTIKKIGDYYILNSNIPAVIKRYTPDINVFVIAARSKETNCDFNIINQSIFEQLKLNIKTPILDEKKLQKLDWDEKIKRTYHLSRNYIMATFDMMDYIFKSNSGKLSFCETPLGLLLVEKYNFSEEYLLSLKEYPLVYIETKNNKKKLINLLDYSKGKSMKACIEVIKRIIN